MADEKVAVVAGATGRAGRLVVQELLKRGYRVRALMVPPFDAPNLAASRAWTALRVILRRCRFLRRRWRARSSCQRHWLEKALQRGRER